MPTLTDRLRTFPELAPGRLPSGTSPAAAAALIEAAHLIAAAAEVLGREPAISDPLLAACVADVRREWARADELDARIPD